MRRRALSLRRSCFFSFSLPRQGLRETHHKLGHLGRLGGAGGARDQGGEDDGFEHVRERERRGRGGEKKAGVRLRSSTFSLSSFHPRPARPPPKQFQRGLSPHGFTHFSVTRVQHAPKQFTSPWRECVCVPAHTLLSLINLSTSLSIHFSLLTRLGLRPGCFRSAGAARDGKEIARTAQAFSEKESSRSFCSHLSHLRNVVSCVSVFVLCALIFIPRRRVASRKKDSHGVI